MLITAETASSDPVNLAGRVARDRAVVAAVGTVGMEIERRIYYEKELDFRISRSYGPGRYDAILDKDGKVNGARARLTLTGRTREEAFGAVLLFLLTRRVRDKRIGP